MLVEIGFDPIFAQIGPFQLGWHGLFTALAVLVAVWLGVARAEARGVPAEPVTNLALFAVVGGVIGARLFHVLDHLDYFAAHPAEVFAVWEGGIAVYGAFIGGIAGGIAAARLMGLPVWTLLDAAAPAMLVGQLIGRLGCLSNGDAWGAPTGGNWGVVYTNPNDLLPPELLGVPTHPYPLYEILCGLLLLGVLWWLSARRPRPGVLFLVAAAGYSLIRFLLTFVRQEPRLLWGLQEAQLVALVTGLLALGLLVLRSARRPALAPQPRPVTGADQGS